MGSKVLRVRRVLLGVLLAAACTTGGDLPVGPGEQVIPDLVIEVLGQHAIRLRWEPAPSVTLRLERRVNLEGEFAALGEDPPRTQTSWLDGELEPSTFYGYRLVGFDAFGKQVGASTVVGARTAPPAGIAFSISTEPAIPPAVDPDGYDLTIAGASDTIRTPVDVTSSLLFAPLAPGPYHLTLGGLAPQCVVADSVTRDVTVTDQGIETVQSAAFEVQCRNPERGRVTAVIASSGELPDPDGFAVQLAGLADDESLPDSVRAYVQTKPIGPAGGSVAFDDIRPGTYAFQISGLAANCTLTGPQQVTFTVAVLDDLQKSFAIACTDPGAANRPFALRPTWAPAAAPTGSKVALDLVLDLSARAGQDLAAFETQIHVGADVLRYDSTAVADMPNVFANQPPSGVLLVSGFTTGTPPTGVVKLARVWFTVVGAEGATTTTQTTHSNTVDGDGVTPLDPDIRTIEGTFTVGTGGGGSNQAPQANANGPYTGTAGSAVTFNAAGSSDPDGTIASYAWTFGDGGTGTGASPTHTYTAAGTFTATLTVTDNLGLTGSATAAVTISGGGGGGGGCGSGTASQPFVLCSAWSPASAAAGDKVLLTQTIDLTSDAAQDLVAFETTVVTDAAVVRFDSARAGGVSNLVVNGSTPGTVRLAGFVTGSGPKGLVTVAKVYYTVLAASGQTTTQTTFSNFVGTSGDLLDGKITKTEGTLTVGGGGGGGPGGGSGSVGGPPGTSALDWQSSFGPVDATTRAVPLILTLDLRSDPAVTLGGWQVTSLSWDPAVLSYATTDFLGGTGAVNATDALQGRLSFTGAPASGGGAGLVTVAIVRFVAFAAPGSSSAVATTLGTITGLTSGGAIDLHPRVVMHDGSFITP